MEKNAAGRPTAATSLPESMFQELEKRIINGELKLGEHINEYAFSESMGVSRGPVREACRRLEQIGLLEFRTNRGFFVREISLEDVLEIYDVRAGLFFHAGRILARRITDLQLEELGDINRQMKEAYARGENGEFYRLNRLFHSRIMAFTGNRYLAGVYERLDRELHLWRKRALVLDGNIRASAEDHDSILEVLRGGNAAKISRSLCDHSLAGRNRLLRTMSGQLNGYTQTAWSQDDF